MKNWLYTAVSVGFIGVSAFGQGVVGDTPPADRAVAEPVEQMYPVPEVTAIDVVYEELFEINHTSSDALFMRPDVDGQIGHDLAVINLDAIEDADAPVEAYTGATFLRSSTHNLAYLEPEYGTVDFEGETWAITTYIFAVSGTVYDGNGEGLDVSGLVYVLEMEGTSIYQNQGVALEHFTPFKVHDTLVSADTHALELAHLDDFGFTDTTDCLFRQASNPCTLAACFCRNEAKLRRQLDLGLCDGISNPEVVLGSIAGGAAGGAAVGTAIASKRPTWFSVPTGIVGGGLIGAIGGAIFGESFTDSQCRRNAETRYRVNLRLIANELNKCLAGVAPFDCPVTFP